MKNLRSEIKIVGEDMNTTLTYMVNDGLRSALIVYNKIYVKTYYDIYASVTEKIKLDMYEIISHQN